MTILPDERKICPTKGFFRGRAGKNRVKNKAAAGTAAAILLSGSNIFVWLLLAGTMSFFGAHECLRIPDTGGLSDLNGLSGFNGSGLSTIWIFLVFQGRRVFSKDTGCLLSCLVSRDVECLVFLRMPELGLSDIDRVLLFAFQDIEFLFFRISNGLFSFADTKM